MMYSLVFLQYSKVIEDFSTILTYEPLLGAPLTLQGQGTDSNTIHNDSCIFYKAIIPLKRPGGYP